MTEFDVMLQSSLSGEFVLDTYNTCNGIGVDFFQCKVGNVNIYDMYQ